MTKSCFGILLAGGRAQRMGGGDKSLRLIGRASILERVIAKMASQCAGLVVNANGDPARFEAFHLPVVADDLPGFKGPLAGILAGLDWGRGAPTGPCFCGQRADRYAVFCGRSRRSPTGGPRGKKCRHRLRCFRRRNASGERDLAGFDQDGSPPRPR